MGKTAHVDIAFSVPQQQLYTAGAVTARDDPPRKLNMEAAALGSSCPSADAARRTGSAKLPSLTTHFCTKLKCWTYRKDVAEHCGRTIVSKRGWMNPEILAATTAVFRLRSYHCRCRLQCLLF